MQAAPQPPQLSPLVKALVWILLAGVAAAIVWPLGLYVVAPAAASGAPGEGQSWGSVFAIVAFSLAVALLFAWALHRLTHTELSDEGLQVPGWRGRRLIRWSEIERVSGRGLQIKLHTASATVTVNPLCYRRPGGVVPFLLRKVPIPALGGRTPTSGNP